MGLEWTQVAKVRRGGHVEVVIPSLKEGTTVEVVIRDEPSTDSTKKRMFGSAKGQGHMTADFDEPLDDFQEYL
jgi:hypothetical protein